MTTRSCGGCTMCCKLMAITELDKPEGKWCPSCDIGKGCAIYGARPQSCSDFSCVWLNNPQLDDTYRPDRIKVVLFEYKDKVTAYCDRPDQWRAPKILHMLRFAARRNGNSIAVCGNSIWIITPTEEREAKSVTRTKTEILIGASA